MSLKPKLLLVNPWMGEIYPPPAIGYLQAIARGNADVKALDLDRALLEPDDYDIVGVTFHSFSVIHAKKIREHFGNAWLVCGGHHPSALPQQMLSIGYNQVVIGEGENAFIDIINGNREQIKTSSSQYYKSIDELPFPDYAGLKYADNIVISSRGCPFRCNFCASTAFWGNKWRARSADNVVREINERGYQTWMFEDDNFTANKGRAIEIASRIKGSWQCASRAENLDNDLCRALKLSGCHTLWLGIESFSQKSLDRCNKHTTVQRMVQGIETATRHGLNMVCQFIIGLPGDTIDDIRLTAKVIRHTKMNNWGVNIAWVLPNTDIYRRAKEHGMSDNVYLETGVPFYTYEHSLDTLIEWRNIIMSAKK